MRIEVLVTPGCRHAAQTVQLVEEVLRGEGAEAAVATITVASAEAAAQLSFPGSPTVRVDGRDIEPNAPTIVGLT